MISFTDNVQIGQTRITKDGFLVTQARVARTGIQQYHGSELGINEDRMFNIFRPESEVFSKESLATYANRPVTAADGRHPSADVTADTWRDSSPAGNIGSEVARDGEFVSVPLVIMDGAAISGINDGTRELSMGYSAVIDMTPGKTPEGEPFDGTQRDLRMNHLAIVDQARGGNQLRIGDKKEGSEVTDKLRQAIVDGLSVETTEQGAQAITKLVKDRDTLTTQLEQAKQALVDAKAEHDKAMGAKDAEIKGLKKAQLSDSQMDEKIAQRQSLIDSARLLSPELDPKGKSDGDIIKSALQTKDSSIDLNQSAEYLRGVFDHMANAAKVESPMSRQYNHNADAHGGNETQKARDSYNNYLDNAWKPKQAGGNH